MSGVVRLNSVARWWADYAEKVIPHNAPRVQVQESKRAFYAGAAAFLNAMMGGLGSDTGEPTEGELAHMDALQAELVQFGADVKAGRA